MASRLLSFRAVNSPESIDRVTPTLEPNQQVVMRQDWHHLLFLHWEIPPSELQALLPAGLDLDTFEGKAYVGLVPFTLTGVRPILTPPLPWISSFHEVNVRTYVHRNGRDPGVWFFSLDASSSIAVAAARAAYKLPYFHSHIDFSASSEAICAERHARNTRASRLARVLSRRTLRPLHHRRGTQSLSRACASSALSRAARRSP